MCQSMNHDFANLNLLQQSQCQGVIRCLPDNKFCAIHSFKRYSPHCKDSLENHDDKQTIRHIKNVTKFQFTFSYVRSLNSIFTCKRVK